MKPRLSADTWLALFFLAAAAFLLFVWIPMDTGTGLVEKVRRKLVIGDALAPTFAASVIAIGAGLILLHPAKNYGISRQNMMWIAALACLFFVSLVLMRYAGPIAMSWIDGGYRPLRTTAPLNYIGFLVGGTMMVGGLTGLTVRRLSFRDFAIGFVTSLVIALLYDLPFDDLMLPPNGDV